MAETAAARTARAARNRNASLEAFLTEKARFDNMVAELRQASADYFGADPDGVLWGEAADLSRWNSLLAQVTDCSSVANTPPDTPNPRRPRMTYCPRPADCDGDRLAADDPAEWLFRMADRIDGLSARVSFMERLQAVADTLRRRADGGGADYPHDTLEAFAALDTAIKRLEDCA